MERDIASHGLLNAKWQWKEILSWKRLREIEQLEREGKRESIEKGPPMLKLKAGGKNMICALLSLTWMIKTANGMESGHVVRIAPQWVFVPCVSRLRSLTYVALNVSHFFLSLSRQIISFSLPFPEDVLAFIGSTCDVGVWRKSKRKISRFCSLFGPCSWLPSACYHNFLYTLLGSSEQTPLMYIRARAHANRIRAQTTVFSWSFPLCISHKFLAYMQQPVFICGPL